METATNSTAAADVSGNDDADDLRPEALLKDDVVGTPVENEFAGSANATNPTATTATTTTVTGKSARQQLLISEEPAISAADFHDNDVKILSLLSEDVGSSYSFKGIMRKLNMHQQSLSRALRRLAEMGLVTRSDQGYRLGRGIVAGAAMSSSQARGKDIGRRCEFVQLLLTYIPVASIKSAEIVQGIAGRWFKSLRWLGMIASGSNSYTLQWTSEDGSFQINLRIVSDYVVIETNASSDVEKVQAMAGSYAIYEHIVRLLQSKIGAYALGRYGGNNNNNNIARAN